MKKVYREIKYWSQIFLLPVYALSFLVPRNKRIWAFGSTFGYRFADNPKYFYLYVNTFETSIRAVWISKNKDVISLLKNNGLEAYYANSFQGFWYALRAKVYLYDNYSKDICFWLSGGAVKINLWHGIPLKKINMDNKFDLVRNPVSRWCKFKYLLRRLSDEKPKHYVLTTSSFLVPIFSSAFNTDNVINCGYPRNDILGMTMLKNILTGYEEASLKHIADKLSKMNKAKTVLYMPTFRESEKNFFEQTDGKVLNEILIMKNILLCIKPHPKSKFYSEYTGLCSDNIIVLEPDADPYVYLNNADILITDYSSIFFDYLLLDRPIVFYCYDLNQYLEESREMYFDYDEFTPGEKAYTFEQLCELLINMESLVEKEEFNEKRSKIKGTVFDEGNCDAGRKLFQYIQRDILKLYDYIKC